MLSKAVFVCVCVCARESECLFQQLKNAYFSVSLLFFYQMHSDFRAFLKQFLKVFSVFCPLATV